MLMVLEILVLHIPYRCRMRMSHNVRANKWLQHIRRIEQESIRSHRYHLTHFKSHENPQKHHKQGETSNNYPLPVCPGEKFSPNPKAADQLNAKDRRRAHRQVTITPETLLLKHFQKEHEEKSSYKPL